MKIKLLTILRLSGASGIPETALRLEVEMRYSISVGDMELRTALSELERDGYASHHEDPLTQDRIWRIAPPQPKGKK